MSLPGEAQPPPPPVFGSSQITAGNASGIFGGTFANAPPLFGSGQKPTFASFMSKGAFATQVAELPSIVFDEHGDLLLTVGSSPSQKMTVDSRALCRTSPVFRKMLSGSVAEPKPATSVWHVKLPKDNPGGFAALMSLIHSCYDRTIDVIDVDKLYEIALLTKNYDMTRVLRPVAQGWLKQLGPAISGHGLLAEKAKLLFSAWEMGDERLVVSLLKNMAEECNVDNNGRLTDSEWKLFEEYKGIKELNVIYTLKNHRQRALEILRQECKKLGQAFICKQSSLLQCHNPPTHNGSEICQDRMVARLVQEAYRLNVIFLFLVDQAPQSVFTLSVTYLTTCLTSIRVSMRSMVRKNNECDPMARVMDNIKLERATLSANLLSEWQKKELATQAAKTGLA